MVWSRSSLNYFSPSFLFFILSYGFIHVTVSQILRGPRVTNWGNWGRFEFCPHNSFVTGFRLKTEQFQGRGLQSDDTALNGIGFRCRSPGSSFIREITSSVGKFGGWGRNFDCENGMYAVGFQLRAEDHQGRGGDNTAANNLRIFCSNGKTRNNMPILEGDGMSWGYWTGSSYCRNGWAICGLETLVEPSQGSSWFNENDDTALNDLNVMCCPIP